MIYAGIMSSSSRSTPTELNWFTGVNLAGAEFGHLDAAKVPGVRDTDYTWPTNAEVDYYAGKGFNCIRLPFLFERIERDQDRGILMGLIDHAASKGIRVILDPHQYGQVMVGGVHTVVSNSVARAAFVAFWAQLADDVAAKSNVIFGLMNEPMSPAVTNGITPAEWLVPANAAISAIRAQGASQLILVPGSYWTGAHSWVSSGNAAVMLGVVDPSNNYAYELHQYMDSDFSGTHSTVVVGSGSTVLAAATSWARTNGKRLFLAETGVAQNSASLIELEAELDFLDGSQDVWIGFTAWAGGPWWYNATTAVDYMFNLDPIPTLAGPEKPQVTILKTHTTPIVIPGIGFSLREDGSYLLREDGSKFLRE